MCVAHYLQDYLQDFFIQITSDLSTIEPMITWVPLGISAYIWLDKKIVFKKNIVQFLFLHTFFAPPNARLHVYSLLHVCTVFDTNGFSNCLSSHSKLQYFIQSHPSVPFQHSRSSSKLIYLHHPSPTSQGSNCE